MLIIFNGTTNFATLLGAFASDTYFGRYKTLGFSSFASFLVLELQSPILHTLTCIVYELHLHQEEDQITFKYLMNPFAISSKCTLIL